MLSKITLALALALAASYVVPASAVGAPTTTGRGGITHARSSSAPSSSNPQATAPNGLLQAPYEVPQNGGAAMFVVPGWGRR